MSRDSECRRLCRLIDDSLRPYTELDAVFIGKGIEKDLLVALSQVLRQIQLWTHDLDQNLEDDPADLMPHYKDHHCSSKVVADLIVFLTLENQYVQHLAGNVLIAISEFLAASGSNWDGFIHLLCVSVELMITNMISYPVVLSTSGGEDSNSDSSSFIVLLRPRLNNARWHTVAGIIRVLRHILKYLKHDRDEELVEVYLDSVNSCLTNVPWDLFDEVQNDHCQKISCTDAQFLRNVGGQESRIIFLGYFVQLLCSLVDQSGCMEATGGSLDKHPILFKILDLVPRLLYWCLGKQGDYVSACDSHYFRHKLLMLMTRLSNHSHLEYAILVSWLQFLHKYFQELLLQPITQLESCQNDCLEGSPFSYCVHDGEIHGMRSCHLQRQVIFLFLRCAISLISLQGESDQHCGCAAPTLFLNFDSNLNMECCSRKKCLLELYKWFQGNLLTDMIVDHEMYLEKCINFSFCFLQLYMQEDDLLFEMLVQLLNVPFNVEQRLNHEKGNFQDVKKDILFHVSNVFNPVHLFHLFLAQLQYDHEVLLDYLISKDTGIRCAEYLLRCLRKVCDSWSLFVEFAVGERVLNHLPCKKRKVLLDQSSFQAGLPSPQAKNDRILPSLEKECEKDHTYGSQCHSSREHPFTEAKECLLSLKKSVEGLYRKNLFPYKPEALLKRLMRFQELCFEQEEKYDV